MTAESSPDSSAAGAAQPLVDLPAAELRRWSAGTLVALLWCAALLIGWRRLAGSITVPLPPTLLLSVGGLVVVVAAGVRLLRPYAPADPRCSRPGWLVPLPTTVAVLAIGAALSLPGTETRGLVAFWAMLLGEELWAWWRPARPRPPGGQKTRPLSRPSGIGPDERPSARPEPAAPSVGLPGDDVLQQLTRSQAADGSDQLCGWLRAPFAAGQRTASVHVAFCPQFGKTPELSVEQLDGPDILRINQTVHAFGARLDLKLASAAADALGVLLQFSARSKPPAPSPSVRKSTP